MNKIIFLSLLLSFPLLAQDIEPLPVSDAPMTEENIEALTAPLPEPAEPEAPEQIETPAPVTTDRPVPEEPIELDKKETPVITTEPDAKSRRFTPYKSHWLTSFGFEGLKYEIPYEIESVDYEFNGVKENFDERNQELWGGRIGVGGEMYLGAGFMTTTKLEGYYVGTLFSSTKNAGPDEEDEEFAFTKTTGQLWGFEVSQSISYLFDMKTKNPIMDEWAYLTVEPFVEAGIGIGWAFNRFVYEYDTGGPSECPTCVDEAYKQIIEDQLVNARISAGFNIISGSGYFFYMKGTVNSFDITERKVEIYKRENGQAGEDDSTTLKDVNIDPVISYAIGGGYKF